MLLTVVKEVGTVSNAVVRYSPQIGGLYSCTGVLTRYEEQDIAKWVGASAPFVVYSGLWNQYGHDEGEDFFKEGNVVVRIPYAEKGWNFM